MKTYCINDFFYSLQGEGRWSGRPAVFIRFSGCNLRCPFCDTDYSMSFRIKLKTLVDKVSLYNTEMVVLTGGEPSLNIDTTLVSSLHEKGKYVAIETNGTSPLPRGIDWITLSPKDIFVDNATVCLDFANEIKLIFTGENFADIERYSSFNAKYFYLQPCDTGNDKTNAMLIKGAVDYCLAHPQWSLSLQTHKIIDIK